MLFLNQGSYIRFSELSRRVFEGWGRADLHTQERVRYDKLREMGCLDE